MPTVSYASTPADKGKEKTSESKAVISAIFQSHPIDFDI